MKDFSEVSFIRVLIPFMRAPPPLPKDFPKAPPLNSITLDVRISTYEMTGSGREGRCIQTTAA